MDGKLQFNLDGKWIDLQPFNPRFSTVTYSEEEQAEMRAAVKKFVSENNCAIDDVKINRFITDDGIRIVVVLKD